MILLCAEASRLLSIVQWLSCVMEADFIFQTTRLLEIHRYHSAVKQQLVSSSSNASLAQASSTVNKADVIRQEMEEAETKVDQCRVSKVTFLFTYLYSMLMLIFVTESARNVQGV